MVPAALLLAFLLEAAAENAFFAKYVKQLLRRFRVQFVEKRCDFLRGLTGMRGHIRLPWQIPKSRQ